MIKFSEANGKLQKLAKVLNIPTNTIYSFDLSAGISCKYGKLCRTKVVETSNGLRVQDYPSCKFRCFAASQEAFYTPVYYFRKNNYEKIKNTRGINQLYVLLQHALPTNANVIRFHSSGDFFKEEYFLTVCKLAHNNPSILFYAYTKALPIWIKYKDKIPNNFILNASYGGTHDYLIKQYNLQSAQVVLSKKEARQLNLPISETDLHATRNGGNFALLIHNVQPSNTKASQALYKILRNKKNALIGNLKTCLGLL